jgi:hypothetical protein
MRSRSTRIQEIRKWPAGLWPPNFPRTWKVEDVQRPSTLKAYISGAYAARKGKAWPIQPVQVNMAGYDRVFVGAPVWWGRPAPEINAFVDQTDLAGKEVVVFVTMGGSDVKGALQMLTSRIEAKGGKVVSSFSIKTGGVKRADIEAKAKEIAAQYMSR